MSRKFVWKKLEGNYVTPGGDPVYICPLCGKGKHLWGVENPMGVKKCPECGAQFDGYDVNGKTVKI